MGEDAADVPAGDVGELAVAPLVEEQGLAVLPQGVVAVHARARGAEERLGHEGGGLARLPGDVLDDVLELHHVVARGEQGGEAVVDLLLAAGAHLVVGPLDGQPGLLADPHHLVAQVRHLVGGGDREVAALEGDLVALVAAGLLAPGVPRGLVGVDGVERALGGGVEAHGVEEVELGLRADVAGVGDAGGAQVVLRLGGDGAGVAREDLIGERVDDREVDDERLARAERIEERRRDIRDELHIRLVDGGEAADRGAVEHEAVGEGVGLERPRRDREVLHDAWKIAEAHIDELDPLPLDVLQCLGGVLEHAIAPRRLVVPLRVRPVLSLVGRR